MNNNQINFQDKMFHKGFQAFFKERTDVSAYSERVLEQWSSAKNGNPVLQNMFRDSLILAKPIEFKESVEAMVDKSEEVTLAFGEIKRYFVRRLEEILREAPDSGVFRYSDESIRIDTSVYNELGKQEQALYDFYGYVGMREKTITLSFLDQPVDRFRQVQLGDFTFPVQKDEKYYRLLNRAIKKVFGKNSEEVRAYNNLLTNLSQLKTVKINKGHHLCLSIHPQDYLGASYGKSWGSCFSPRGDHAASISATMLSRDTVVAYLLTNEDYQSMINDPYFVPRKIWRSFLLLNPERMALMHTYPYFSPDLYRLTHEWVQELTETEYIFRPKPEEGDYSFYPSVEIGEGYLNTSVPAKEIYGEFSLFTIEGKDMRGDWDGFGYFDFQAAPVFWDTGEPTEWHPIACGNGEYMFEYEVADLAYCVDCDEITFESEMTEREHGLVCQYCNEDYEDEEEEEEEEEQSCSHSAAGGTAFAERIEGVPAP